MPLERDDITMYCPPLTRKTLTLTESVEIPFPGVRVRQKNYSNCQNKDYIDTSVTFYLFTVFFAIV